MLLNLERIKEARERIAPYIVKTPMLRLQNLDAALGCQVYAKAECMQITGAFKLRGAMNKALSFAPGELKNGIVAASSGNHGKAVSYAARLMGVKATIVVPRTAAQVKVEAIRAFGAEVVLCETSERFNVAERLRQEQNAVIIPPFNDEDIMAGQGTAGLEIMEQCPELDKLVVPTSGGGLLGGVSTAVKAISPKTKIYGAAPAALPHWSASLAAGHPVTVERRQTIADALVSHTPGSICFPCAARNIDGVADVADGFLLKGMKLLLMEGKLLAEPSSCIGIGAVLQGLIPVTAREKVCFLISGGSVGLEQLKMLEGI